MSSLFKKDDWWAIWVGFIIIIMGIFKSLPGLPQIAKWTDLAKVFPAGIGTFQDVFLVFILLGVLTFVAITCMDKDYRKYWASYVIIFLTAFLAMFVGKYATLANWGLETVLWALFIGLIIGNLIKLPEWMKAGIQTEFFIKIGLVLLGAEILFSTVVKAGMIAMIQALIVVLAVWFFAYWVCRKFAMEKTFASVMATGVSICGVSAAIAASGAVKGKPKETSYVISMVLLVAMPMLVGMPLLAKAIGLDAAMAGAWMGGTIDTTAAVVAAGTLVDPKTGLTVASVVKMAQNILIGFAAFIMAIWATVSVKKESGGEKPSVMEIWYRFPKFILGFIVASLVMSFIVEPSLGSKGATDIINVTKGYREWFFVLGFVCVGLETRFKELIAVGKGKPALAFIIAQAFNIVFVLGVVYLLWSGVLFPRPV